VNEHDIAESHTYDDGVFIRCACGKTFDGPAARDEHATHHRIERDRATALEWIADARRHLRGEHDGT